MSSEYVNVVLRHGVSGHLSSALSVLLALGCSSTSSPGPSSSVAGGNSAVDAGASGAAGAGSDDAPPVELERYDVVVYGATSGGVAAAVQVARMEKSVVLISPTAHIGGLTSGGLGATDAGDWNTITGISKEFYEGVASHYEKPDAWVHQTEEEFVAISGTDYLDDPRFGGRMMKFEPHVAKQTFMTMLEEAGVPIVVGERLDLQNGVQKEAARIVSIKMESGKQYAADMFIDTTYEGDLMAHAGVSYVVGRESNEEYGESLNGSQPFQNWGHNFNHDVDPYVTPGDVASGLLFGITDDRVLPVGQGDNRVQAYNFRMCLTNVPENRVPIEKPENYDPSTYELLGRYYAAGYDGATITATPDKYGHVAMPNGKSDTNNSGVFSTDFVGMNYDYPDGDYETRERIIEEHRQYQLGLLWFLQTDERIPESIRSVTASWGLPKDEYPDNDHWSPQLYVREARRMIGAYVMTEHNVFKKEGFVVEDPIAIASYPTDSHNVRRYVGSNGKAKAEGFFIKALENGPFSIAYRAIHPIPEEASNLLVTFALSASHVAFGTIRMEPVFMMTSQAAGTAAVLSIDAGTSVQGLEYAKLQARLKQDGLQLVK